MTCGTTRAGSVLCAATSSSPAMPARSPCSRSRSAAALGVHVFAGELRRGRFAARGGRRRSPRRPGASLPPYGALALAAWRGREAEAAALIERQPRRGWRRAARGMG